MKLDLDYYDILLEEFDAETGMHGLDEPGPLETKQAYSLGGRKQVVVAATELRALVAAARQAYGHRATLSDIHELVKVYFSPWGAAKTAWWEDQVGDHLPFGPENLLREIQRRAKATLDARPLPPAEEPSR